MKKSLIFIILWPFVACGGVKVSQGPVVPAAARPAECAAFFENLDERVEAAGVRNAADAAVPGFPYLRANRFLAALGLRLKGEAARDSWGRWMQELDLKGRKAEIRNLPEEAVQALAGGKDAAAREALIARVASCSEELARHDRTREDYFAAVQAKVHIQSEYSTFLRVIGLHPLTAIPVAVATESSRTRIRKWFAGDLDSLPVEGRLRTFFPRQGSPGEPEEIARIVSGAMDPSLGAPRPAPSELAKLARAFAPVIVQDTAQPFDAIGKAAWRGDQAEILPDSPALYYFFSHAFLNAKPILQIQYVVWYGGRGGETPPWFERGRLDGLTLRFWLDSQGKLFMVDGMNNCGCYHFFAPDRARVSQVLFPSSATPPFVPQDLPNLGPGERLGLKVNSGWHQVQRLFAFRDAAAPIFYDLLPYEDLESLPTERGPGKSLFDAKGIVPGTERSERIFLFPMGVPRVGSMRQRGHHAIDFIGRAHFDDPDLLERNFVLQ